MTGTRVVVVAMALIAACDAGARKPPPPSPPAPSPPPVPVPAPPPGDAAIDMSIDLTKAEWPIGVEMTTFERHTSVGEFTIDVSYPRFRTKPITIGVELNKRLGALDVKDDDFRQTQGLVTLYCDVELVNRLAVVGRCKKLLDARTLQQAREGTGGAPAGSTPFTFAWWLQPGLPAIKIHELAPGIDVAALIARSYEGAPYECAKDQCPLDPDTFLIDSDGIQFVPTDYCPSSCTDRLPTLAFDQLKPTHPWAVKLLAWIRKRIDANQGLVKLDE